MSLRYKGKPDRGANVIADGSRFSICLCKFIRVGFSMDTTNCKVHSNLYYACDQCHCGDYRPNTEKKSPNHWPLCVCGHVAQEHN